MKPERFSGSGNDTDFQAFLDQFEICAKVKNWNKEEKANQLILCMKEKARMASLKNNKIFIFRKSSLGIAEVIRSSLSVDVSRYAKNSELFVCIDKCYQHLIKVNQASDKLKELKKINRRSLQGKRKWFSIYFYIP